MRRTLTHNGNPTNESLQKKKKKKATSKQKITKLIKICKILKIKLTLPEPNIVVLADSLVKRHSRLGNLKRYE